MKTPRNILMVCRDHESDQNAWRCAEYLARRHQARLHLVSVMDLYPGELTRLWRGLTGSSVKAAEQALIDARKAALDREVARLAEAGIEASATCLQGTPFLEVIRLMLAGQHDLVITGPDRRGGDGPFGSDTLHLLRKCPCPVLAVRPGWNPLPGRILAAIDPAPEDAERQALAADILDTAAALAESPEMLHIVHAWELYGEETLRHGAFSSIPEDEVDTMLAEVAARSRYQVNALIADRGITPESDHIHLVKGTAAAVLPEQARRLTADVIVMGTVGRTGIAGLLISNTAESVLGTVPCSVLAIKPAGFQSPVSV